VARSTPARRFATAARAFRSLMSVENQRGWAVPPRSSAPRIFENSHAGKCRCNNGRPLRIVPVMPETEKHRAEAQPLFATTRWSVVLAAKETDSIASEAALETLCRSYWYPLYAFIRSSGHSPHDAQDLTQEFFARLLARDYLRAVERESGRFRTFLRMALKRFLANEWDRVRAQKRGGGQVHIRFDTSIGEQVFQLEHGTSPSPASLYEKRWALALLDGALAKLEREQANTGKSAEFQHLRSHLTADRGAIPYAELAAVLQISEGGVRVIIHRLRKRFREVFREMVADTVSAPGEVDDEFRHVIAILSGA
jgi:RNA polymerase sigma factor (sigma-70 family)